MVTPRKTKTAFYCSQCGAEHSKWQGQCRECAQWNCLIEERMPTKSSPRTQTSNADSSLLSSIGIEQQSGFTSGIVEFDRVLGGQLLPGMTVLLGGEPGIGKSTLVLQAADAYSQQGLNVLYITGEESLPQIKRRADRLQVSGDNITVVNSSSLEQMIERVGSNDHQVVIIDSIQTVASELFDSPPGTVAQVREAANKLITMSKAGGWALFLIGHVTKEGLVAGPKVLEHMVDTVVYFEGDSAHLYRMLRATKNRFGSIAEIGLFEMAERGLIEVANPSSLFLTGHSNETRSGSVVAGIVEGNRPILVELQALVTAAGYSNPQRVAGGIDNRRLSLLLAILEKRCDYPMATNDVFVSVAGGLKLSEPGIDLPLLVAIVSSLLNRAIDPKTILVGEVGLSGEVRPVAMIDRRINEAARMGFTRMILPQANLDKLTDRPLQLTGVTNLQQALEVVG
ncbi:MAG: DNA repair protein RadA [candidate division Zixibacteria bacterium]|nr:DNA repair protein RadA [candidate division Zixibacteria bacterium]MDH3936876.1 DNA repair protein RadA [candidate division Zixibacteria bacterium]MDH4033613.1 DNA repair protein RadA [candidate division Zixibacteria bacterium]